MRRVFAVVAVAVFSLCSFGLGKGFAAEESGACEDCKQFRGIVPSEEQIASRLSSADRMVAFSAYRHSDTTMCKKALDTEACYDSVQLFALIETLAKGRCDNLPVRYRADYKPVCEAIKNNSCGIVDAGVFQDLCRGLAARNRDRIAAALRNPLYPEIPKNPDDMADMILNLYSAYRDGKKACPPGKSLNIVINASCDMLFGSAALTKQIPGLAKDMRVALLARNTEKPGLCSGIIDPHVRAVCQTGNYETFEQLLDQLWY